VSPEDLFNMFFNGGGMGGHGFQAHFGGPGMGRRGGRPQQQQQQRSHGEDARQGGGFNSLLQFLPIILMLLMSFSSFSTNSHAPVFQLSPQGTYMRERFTSAPGVSPDIKYYVNQQFDSQYKPRSEQFRRVEKEVESEYKHFLGMKCGNEKTFRNNRLYQSRFSGQEARKRAEELTMPSCEEFTKRFLDTAKNTGKHK
jgi:DnaJ homolog subfamily B member 12